MLSVIFRNGHVTNSAFFSGIMKAIRKTHPAAYCLKCSANGWREAKEHEDLEGEGKVFIFESEQDAKSGIEAFARILHTFTAD